MIYLKKLINLFLYHSYHYDSISYQTDNTRAVKELKKRNVLGELLSVT